MATDDRLHQFYEEYYWRYGKTPDPLGTGRLAVLNEALRSCLVVISETIKLVRALRKARGGCLRYLPPNERGVVFRRMRDARRLA